MITGSEAEPFEEANSKLAAGLKSCRTVVSNYRSLLLQNPAHEGTSGDAVHDGDIPSDSVEE